MWVLLLIYYWAAAVPGDERSAPPGVPYWYDYRSPPFATREDCLRAMNAWLVERPTPPEVPPGYTSWRSSPAACMRVEPAPAEPAPPLIS